MRKIFICFDMNGVLIDDEKLHYLSFKETIIEKYNQKMSYDCYKKNFAGKTDYHGFYSYFCGDNSIDYTSLQDEKTKKYKEYISSSNDNFKKTLIIHQINKILINLKKNDNKIALVTGSIKQETETVLNFLGLNNIFDLVITKEDYENSKPHPEAYLSACNKMGYNPENTLVIEDSPSGVASAKAAGCHCLAITTTHIESDLINADLIVKIDNVERVLKNFIKKFEDT